VIREDAGAIVFDVQVVPRASREKLSLVGDRIKVQLTAPPVDGAANEALRAFIGKLLGVPKSKVAILRGETGRKKTLRVEGASAERLREVAS
jgi:uncharacterized protein (TIGR00251 family)